MKHQRDWEIAKIEARRKSWDILGFSYRNQPHRLWKWHSLKCNCMICTIEKEWKRLEKKRERIAGRTECRDVILLYGSHGPGNQGPNWFE